MDKKTVRIFMLVIYFLLVSITILVMFNNYDTNRESAVLLFGLAVFLIVSFSVRFFCFYRYSRHNKFAQIMLLVDIMVVYWINLQDISNISQLYFYVLASDGIIFCYHRVTWIYAPFSYFSLVGTMIYKFTRWNYFDFWYLFAPLMEYTVYFVFTVVVVYALKHQINQKRVLDSTMDELRIRKLNLETTNRKLHETMEALEEMTVLKERNRIAREIHDTVGHTLTTVLIEIEAGKRLMQKKPDLAEEKLELAQEQVRKGLNDIRKSVRMLKEGSDLMTFIPSIHSLIEETEKHTGVSVKCIFADLPKMSAEQEKLLYRALQEGLTNGIRHGHGTEFEFTLEICDGRLYFILKDNGDGFDHITLGFGLTVMKERVKELDGNFDIFSQKGQGCCLRIDIPVKKEIVYESYSNSYSG